MDAGAAGCYSAGSVAGAVLGTALACACLAAAAYAFWRFYWRPRRARHLVLVTDPENGKDDYAFDNPCFREGTPVGRTLPGEKDVGKLDQKTRWSAWSPLGVIVARGDKRKALDDSFLAEPQVNVVALRSHDFTGLGFNICGNMRDGIYIKDVLHRGPASESGRITPGDRIDSVRISFRHMVFEDALTILSYASPYEVQLEVENATSSRPSTLIRTKRMSGSNAAFGDRICHPFYRSQSIADLAQIGKDSLKRMQQMEGITKSPRTIKPEGLDDLGAGDYPTLKLSSSPGTVEARRENAGLEKAAVPQQGMEPAVVKPERTKRSSQASPEAHSPEDGGTLSKFQKFGVRVLPDPNAGNTMRPSDSAETPKMRSTESPRKNGVAEPEKHQNEQNSMIEKSSEEVSPAPRKQQNRPKGNIHPSMDIDVVDGRRPIAETFYDERGIDVGPVELQKKTSTGHFRVPKVDSGASGKYSDPEGHSEMGNEGAKESNVKQLITKGFQNLKEKFHSIDRKKSGSTSETTDDESYAQNEKDLSSLHQKHLTSDSRAAEIAKNSKDTLNKEMSNKTESMKYSSNIPTNLPEEVRRAAIAAVNNRRSSGAVVSQEENKPNTLHSHERSHITSQDSISGDSSSEEDRRTSAPNYDTDSSERLPKKSPKRKAPLPPPEGEEDVECSLVESGNNSPKAVNYTHTHPQQIKTEIISIKGNSNPKPAQTADKILTSFGNIGVQINNTEAASNITERNQSPQVSKNVHSNSEKEHEETTDVSNEVDMTNQDLINANMSDVNTESDSDVEKKSQEFYEAKRSRKNKGGTKIELNSSHITIHHNPSDMAVDMENESTRKAASLGDLSRLDSEQPMSILERAVSLDLADGGTPHGTKKRKAPLPPPGEDYLVSAQDSDEGSSCKKEPRLDGAMDTFQRRRLKKSSDWGTLEDALQQNNQNFSDQKSFLLNTNTTEVTQGKTGVDKPNSTSTEFDTGVQGKISVETISSRHDRPNIHTSSIIESFIMAEKKHSDALKFIPIDSPSRINIESSALKRSDPKNDSEDGEGSIEAREHQRKMVLHVNPDAHVTTQVTILPATTSTYERYGNATGEGDRTSTMLSSVSSSENLPSRIVSSTPLHNIASEVVSSTPRNQHFHSERTTLQSPLISSSNVGISNIHVTSTQDSSDLDTDPNMLVTSATDPFVTAMTTADSTTYSDNFEDDSTWEQPPELPTSPIPASTSSSYIASPSMTYITEIQVVTSTDNTRDIPLDRKAPSNTKTVSQEASSVLGGAHDQADSNLTSDSIGSKGDQKEVEAIVSGREPHTDNETKQTGQALAAQKSNVTVTAIRNTAGSMGNVERSRIPTRIHQPDNVKSLNHVEENKVKPARPPVPPRKSEASSSLITVQGPVSNHAANTSSSGKFISFSSLTPRSYPQDSVPGRNSSFEKWVFLDDSNTSNVTKLNGLESVSNDDVKNTQQHSTVVTFPTSTPNRTQTITHIVLDTKSGNNTGKM
ncbi:uncharacterized protein LOC134541775 [Bacillus rossius redtenbacheri]|uniref:uncharacterized protein LOC134541775 n=1 Tax=Bacillus rossius redtenbacheri TaxID=93214 RepID=UPI002FDE1726